MVSIRFRSVTVAALAGLACLVGTSCPSVIGGTRAPNDVTRAPSGAARQAGSRDAPAPGGLYARTPGADPHQHWTRYRMQHAIPTGDASLAPRADGWLPHGPLARYIGKIFFQLDGVVYVCSGVAVRSPGADVVATAAHCLSDGMGGYATNWTFVPGYQNGSAPYGSYSPRMFYLSRQWAGGRNEAYDVAFVTLNRGISRGAGAGAGAGTGAGARTGTATAAAASPPVSGLPIAFDQPPGKVHVFGYPAQSPFDGTRLRYCAGQGTPGIKGTSGLRCDMTAGDSGGPWLSKFDPVAGTGTVVAVTSFRVGDSQKLYGSGMNRIARKLYNKALAGS